MITTLLVILGILVIYFSLIVKYVAPPFEWVIEINLPWLETIKIVWKSGLRLLWLPIKPLMFVRNKLYCADKEIIVTMGVADKNPGNPSLVEFIDASAGVIIQLILKVEDPLKATYEIENYETAAVQRAESTFRKIFAGMKLDEAMTDVDKRSKISCETYEDVNEAISDWGVALTNPGKEITIIDFVLSDDLTAERQRVINAEKARREAITTAEGTKAVTILTKQGEAEGIRLVKEAEGKSEGEKVKLLRDHLGLSNGEAIEYLLKLGMIDAVKGSTIIATSRDGELNTPVGLAATMFAAGSAKQKPSGGENS